MFCIFGYTSLFSLCGLNIWLSCMSSWITNCEVTLLETFSFGCLIYWLLLRSKLILKIGSTYVTRTQIEVSDTGMCLSVGLIKLRILRHLDTDIRCPIFGHEHLDIAIKYDSFFWIFYVCVIIYYYMQC